MRNKDAITHASWDLSVVEAGYIEAGFRPRMTFKSMCGNQYPVAKQDDLMPTCEICRRILLARTSKLAKTEWR